MGLSKKFHKPDAGGGHIWFQPLFILDLKAQLRLYVEGERVEVRKGSWLTIIPPFINVFII